MEVLQNALCPPSGYAESDTPSAPSIQPGSGPVSSLLLWRNRKLAPTYSSRVVLAVASVPKAVSVKLAPDRVLFRQLVSSPAVRRGGATRRERFATGYPCPR